MRALLAPGFAADATADLLWNRAHGEAKRVADVAAYVRQRGWAAQVTAAAEGGRANAPKLTEDAAMLMVDEALRLAGSAQACTRDEVRLGLRASHQSADRRRGLGRRHPQLDRHPLARADHLIGVAICQPEDFEIGTTEESMPYLRLGVSRLYGPRKGALSRYATYVTGGGRLFNDTRQGEEQEK
ncbi:hypothetical protein EPN44_12520 [bacterium]|nr:MAG: hypothetical protein EPN44_12520 [bacterium]